MKLEFISNTGFYLENKGKVFGMDLWTTQGAFEGSWYHYPPLCKTKWDISDFSEFHDFPAFSGPPGHHFFIFRRAAAQKKIILGSGAQHSPPFLHLLVALRAKIRGRHP